MKVLHLAAGNRWTGAAAPAFAEVEALRAAGIDAHFAYVGGYKLQQKIGNLGFTHPVIEKAQNPFAFKRTVDVLCRVVHQYRFDIVHAHLTHDHWLARMVARNHDIRVARTFHARRVLRNDFLSRSLVNATEHLFVINDSFQSVFPNRQVTFTPPPVDHRQFSPEGENARSMYGIGGDEKIVAVIGKVAPGRGFEEALQTFAELRRITTCRLLIIGHGPHRPFLENLARSIGVEDGVIWAGYHEDDLAEHFRAANLLLFTARGSDEGHRAILEAMACGVPTATMPLEGVEALVPSEWIAPTLEPAALAVTASTLLADPPAGVAERSIQFGYEAAAARLIAAYGL